MQFAGPFSKCSDNSLEDLGDDTASKKRRICTQDGAEECLDKQEAASATANSVDDKLLSGAGNTAETDTEGVPGLSLVKLTRSGLLLFTSLEDASPNTVDVVSNIIQAFESGCVKSPAWCHRIFPIQATCGLNEKELQDVVSMLVKKFVYDKRNILQRPLKFAVGYNRRGIDETKSVKEKSKDSSAFNLLDRNKCFGIVASAVNQVVGDSVVDLRTPELCVLVEVLPISGVPNGSIVVAVSVLPRNLVSTKPRLCIRALNSNTKEGCVAE
ncbi:hypothetical protein PIB30_068246 [Stylosanthes scabra]|uniref:THUMP domain-containing protein n=1 Tax=Stylosanthes scabra TaxID=79078 RepID=A0ABU6TMM0_9FABA|nr:hypothetical protein [Stylosanthes scabra]